MDELLLNIFDTSDFPARWHCGRWTPTHGWLHVVSDIAIWGAYVTIPATLIFLVLRRRDVPFPRVFWLFGAFIVSCGTVHLVEATIFWWPAYRLSGAVKLFTAVVSWATVLALVPVIPQALRWPGLAAVNTQLMREIDERKRVEEELKSRTAEIEDFNALAVGREERMIELKRQVNALAERLGERQPYDLSALT